LDDSTSNPGWARVGPQRGRSGRPAFGRVGGREAGLFEHRHQNGGGREGRPARGRQDRRGRPEGGGASRAVPPAAAGRGRDQGVVSQECFKRRQASELQARAAPFHPRPQHKIHPRETRPYWNLACHHSGLAPRRASARPAAAATRPTPPARRGGRRGTLGRGGGRSWSGALGPTGWTNHVPARGRRMGEHFIEAGGAASADPNGDVGPGTEVEAGRAANAGIQKVGGAQGTRHDSTTKGQGRSGRRGNAARSAAGYPRPKGP